MENRVTIKIPRTLYSNLKELIADTGFSSVNEFIVFVMRSIASAGTIKSENKPTENELQVILARLRRLGYLKED